MTTKKHEKSGRVAAKKKRRVSERSKKVPQKTNKKTRILQTS